MALKISPIDFTMPSEKFLLDKATRGEAITESDTEAIKKEVKNYIYPEYYTKSVIIVFFCSFALVAVMIVSFTFLDAYHAINPSYNRFLTPLVIMSLISGTVLQSGSAFYLVGRALLRSG